MVDAEPEVTVRGHGLKIGDVVRVARHPETKVEVKQNALDRVDRVAARISQIVEKYKEDVKQEDPPLTYGITTGFGEFKKIAIDPEDVKQLQENILLSHSAGVGEGSDPDDPSSYFPAEVVRAALLLRLNTFLRGNSGVTVRTVECVRAMLNQGVVPLVPTRGSVGSSGDLAPLAHLFSVLVRAGRFYQLGSGKGPADARPGSDLGELVGAADGYQVSAKEGLALTNGAAFSAAMLALAVHDAEVLADTADACAALSLEALCGCTRAFDPRVHQARHMPGQQESARTIRRLLRGSKLVGRAEAERLVQDAYSFRCAPQVHGASRDAIAYARTVVESEINATTDNPIIFTADEVVSDPEDVEDQEVKLEPEDEWWGREFASSQKFDWPTKNWDEVKIPDSVSYSAGNFHGQPVGLAADFLAIALSELANISERRIQALLDDNHNRELPANLVARGGVNSGFMIAQYTAASLVSENKVLAHPASVDSIPTSANVEDHVSMATTAARKLRTVLENTRAVLAIELLVATHAVDWRTRTGPGGGVRPLVKEPASAAGAAASQEAPAGGSGDEARAEPARAELSHERKWREAQQAADAFYEAVRPEDEETWAGTTACLGRGTGDVYQAVRRACGFVLVEDAELQEPIRRVRELIETGAPAEIARRRRESEAL